VIQALEGLVDVAGQGLGLVARADVDALGEIGLATQDSPRLVDKRLDRPGKKVPFLPIFASASSICGPPPCTTTGFMPTSFISTTSSAKSCCSDGSVIALPPYLMTMVLPWNWRM
jgi:hypothetical protein